MSALDKEQLLSIINVNNKPELRYIEGFGDVHIKKMTVAEQSELSRRNKNDSIGASLYMIACSLCDEDGNRLFGDSEVKRLSGLSAEQMDNIATVINEVNKFDQLSANVKKN